MFTITHHNGSQTVVRHIAGTRNAEEYIRTLIKAGVSYSVETDK